MDLSPFYFNRTECLEYCDAIIQNDYDVIIQNDLNKPMPWIGMYIAAASALYSIATAADAINGFRSKKYWIPCKYFSLNSTSLTVLAVAMKLTVDLTSSMMGLHDKTASVSSLVLMSTAMANFTTSLASMDDNELLLNLVALGILVFTITGNVIIHHAQTSQVLDGQVVLAEESSAVIFMLLLLFVLCSSSIVVPTTRRYIASKYQEMHKIVSSEGGFSTNDELRVTVKKYMVMAESGSPQFVMARSAFSCTSGVMCLLMALTLVETHIRLPMSYDGFGLIKSNYRWSINWILYIQSIGVALGVITPISRWFIVVRFRISEIKEKSVRDIFQIETYWTLKLVEWREKGSVLLQIRHHRCRKLLHHAKVYLLSICVGIQVLFVLISKLVLFLSGMLGCAIFLCFNNLSRPDFRAGANTVGSELELDFSHYVLLLEGEPELPKNMLTNICNEVDELIETGRRDQPKNLIDLLQKSHNFNGVWEFDNKSIPILHALEQEPPNCWSLPMVTLTSIALSLPNIPIHKSNQLSMAVGEGLHFVKLIEKSFDRNGDLANIRNAADVVWTGVELYKKWQDKDLKAPSHYEALQKFSNIAEKTVRDFSNGAKDYAMKNPFNWSAKVIAASSMYRISQTTLLALENNQHETDEKLFERLSMMISDILSACLTNLLQVVILKCHSNAFKEREKSVREAAVLLGESEGVLDIMRRRKLPAGLDPNKSSNIEEWRALIWEDEKNLEDSNAEHHVHIEVVV